jgi:fumarate reductase flavoprotein subunit
MPALALMLAFPRISGAVELDKRHAKGGVGCVDCHGEASPQKAAKASACIGCHTDTPGAVKPYPDQGVTRSVNVHQSHEGTLRCTLCHHAHKESTLYCNQCHKLEVKVP